ncbi:UNVERIFIED_CONTAM: hypothetical protein K2H54_048167 [Gekko kuhli]
MFRKKKKKRPEISAPQNFEHRVHTSFDPKEGKFIGLPPQWQNILDTLKRPKPVVDPSRITRVQLQPMKNLPSFWVHLRDLGRKAMAAGSGHWGQEDACSRAFDYLSSLAKKDREALQNSFILAYVSGRKKQALPDTLEQQY